MNPADGDFGLWSLVIVNTLCFAGFAGLLLKPATRADWGMLGALTLFLCAHFAERYGFPLSLQLLGAWQPLIPQTHDAGHLWPVLFGTSAHLHPLYFASFGFILGGYGMLACASHELRHAQRAGRLATTGLYAQLRHPQLVALALIIAGFLLQWPTLPTLALLPVLLALATRAVHADDDTLHLQFGLSYAEYAGSTPACLPRLLARPGLRTEQ